MLTMTSSSMYQADLANTTILPTPCHNAACPAGFVSDCANICYAVFGKNKDHSVALSQCTANGGTLPWFNEADEYTLFRETVPP